MRIGVVQSTSSVDFLGIQIIGDWWAAIAENVVAAALSVHCPSMVFILKGAVKQRPHAVRPVPGCLQCRRDRISTFFCNIRTMSTPDKPVSSEDIIGQKVSIQI